MKKTTIMILILLCAGIAKASDTLFFKVTLLGIHCASVEVIENRISDEVTEIAYHAYTVDGFHAIYKIDNWYYYYTDATMTHIDSLRKEISNRSMQQTYREHIRDGVITYSEPFGQEVNAPVHHILSMLVYLQHEPGKMRTGESFPFIITDEGDLYKPSIRVERNEEKAQDEIYFSFTHIGGHEILEPTDVFNWMICAGGGTRMLAYSHDDHLITEGAFSLGLGLHLRAKRIYR